MNLTIKQPNAKHLQQVSVRAIICSMLLVLPSCGIPYLRMADPGPGLPANFNGANNLPTAAAPEGAPPDSSAQLTIEEFYNDSTLLRLMDQALVSNRDLKMLNEEVQAARNEIIARQGAYLPFVFLRQRGAG